VEKQPFAASICRALAAWGICFPQFHATLEITDQFPVGAAEGCDLLIFKDNIKRSQPSAAPTQACGMFEE
jgi:hypothetical protein